MDGYSLTRKLADLLDESLSTSGFLDSQTSYDYLFMAAIELARRTKALTAEQTITTVADQAAYDLDPEYLGLYVTNSFKQFVVKLNDGTNDRWLTFKPDPNRYFNNNTTSTQYPYNFSIRDKRTLTDSISGTATSDGAASSGECTLTDSSAPFGDVEVGDTVHNTTDDSHGVVIELTSSSAIVTCLFGGTNNAWTSSDGYVVVPQGRKQIVLDPPPSTASYTLTVPYFAKPEPVYSPYRAYRFPDSFEVPLVKYAAWLYKYKDRDPNFGDAFYKHFDIETRKVSHETNMGHNRYRMGVNFNRRSLGDRSLY